MDVKTWEDISLVVRTGHDARTSAAASVRVGYASGVPMKQQVEPSEASTGTFHRYNEKLMGMRTFTPAASMTTTQGAMLKMLTSMSTPAMLVLMGSHSYENTAGAAAQTKAHVSKNRAETDVHELDADNMKACLD